MTLSAIASTTFSSAPPASVGHHSAWSFTTFRTRPAPRSVRHPLKAHHLGPVHKQVSDAATDIEERHEGDSQRGIERHSFGA